MIKQIRRFFSPNQGLSPGEALYEHLIKPESLGQVLALAQLPDSFTGRFEALALSAAVALGEAAESMPDADAYLQALRRDLVGALVRDIDISFREQSLGDATVKKHATNHASAFYGRLKAYGQPDILPALRRNLYADAPTPDQEAALPELLHRVRQVLGGGHD